MADERKSAQERLADALAPDAGNTVRMAQVWQNAFVGGDQGHGVAVSSSKCHNSSLRGAYVVEHAVSQWFRSYGKERVVFMTLTLPGGEPSRKTILDRWNACRKSLLESGILWGGLRVLERGERNGRWHIHVVGVLSPGWRHRGTYSWWKNPLGRWCIRNPGQELRRLWEAVNRRCKACGFGRVECLPVRTEAKKAASYVAGYLEKAKPEHGNKGRQRAWFGKSRLTGICATYGWSWASGNGWLHRRWCRWVGACTGINCILKLNQWVKFAWKGAWGTVFDLVRRGKSDLVVIRLNDQLHEVANAIKRQTSAEHVAAGRQFRDLSEKVWWAVNHPELCRFLFE